MDKLFNKELPLVSVNMVAHNSEQHIGQSIKSILNQTYTNFELIIVNDGSNDKTLKEINNFNDPRIKLINLPKNVGIPIARNIALENSYGKYIAIQDSDDVSLKHRISKQIQFLEKNTDYGLVGSRAELIDSDGKSLNKFQSQSLNQADTKVMLFFKNCFTHSSVMYRRNILKKIMFNENLKMSEDYDAIIKISSRSKIRNLNEILVNYRHHKSSVTNNLLLKEKAEKIIIGIQLERLGISKTKINITAHKNFKIRTIHKDIGLAFAQLGLLEKLLLSNKERKIFPEHEFSNRLLRYWNNIMNNSCKYSLKLLYVYMSSSFFKFSKKSLKSHIKFVFRCFIGYEVKF